MGIESVEALMIKDEIPEGVALVSAYIVVALETIGGILQRNRQLKIKLLLVL